MATGSLYGSVSESTGLYGIGAASGGTYFEWFIFYDSATAPATPTGGSWSFTTNTGTAPSGWLNAPPAAPTNLIWVSIAVVDSRSTSTLTWSAPGLMTGAGLPVLTGSGVPSSGTGLNGQLYINTATTPQSMYNKQSGAWVQITGSTLYATSGANTNITSLTGITGGISSATYLQLNTAGDGAVAAGKAQWDPTFGGPSIGMAGGNVNQIIGQDQFVYVYNNTGSTIAKGQVVYVSGSQGQRITVGLAQANADATSISVLGFAAESISNNSSGFIASVGLVQGINTSGFADGVSIWLSPTVAGGFTVTKPVAPNHLVLLGYVVKGGSVGAGSIYVFTQNGYELDELHDVLITAVANGNYLKYNSSIPAWVNVAGPTGTLVGTTDTQTLTNKTISGLSNTLSNIANSSLSNSTITINGSAISLGGSATIASATPNNLVFGSGLSANASFNGSQQVNLTLASVGTAGTYGDSGTIPVFTTNAFGQISGVSLQSVVVDSSDISGTIAIAQGGTGASSVTNARVNLLPSYTGNAGKLLALNSTASDLEWKAVSGVGTVTSVDVSGGTTGLTTFGGPITAAGTITLGGTLAVANGGTGVTSSTGTGNVVLSNSPTLVTPALGTPSSGVVTNLTGTASININGTVGATTASTGAFTTLAASSTVTLSGGTANGVAYLNGSKVVTSGSALTYDGTTLSTDTINNTQLYIGASVGTPILTLFGESASIPVVGYRGSGGLRFGTVTGGGGAGFSEQMRLTSTGLGIGTSSPAYKLDVRGLSGNIASWSDGTTTGILYSGGGYVGLTFPAATGGFFINPTGNFNTISTNGSERVRIDSSGNLGLGVTPSATNSTYFKSLEVGRVGQGVTTATSNLTSSPTTWLSNNSYATYSSGVVWLYANSQPASLYRLEDAAHKWYTAPSGTAGTTITFTQAMTLNASGNLGIGTTSPAAILATSKSSSTQATGLLLRNPDGSTGSSISIDFETSSGTSGSESSMAGRIAGVRTGAGTSGALTFSTTSSGVLGERARIDSSGNMGLGVTPSAWSGGYVGFQVKDAAFASFSSGYTWVGNNWYNNSGNKYIGTGNATLYEQNAGKHSWLTAASGTAGNAITFTQAMTLDASGRLALGSTSILGTSNVASFTNTISAKSVLAIQNTSASGYSSVELYNSAGTQTGAMGYGNASVAVTGAQDNVYLYSASAITFLSGGTTERARIDSSGNLVVNGTSAGVVNNNAFWTSTSSYFGQNHANGTASGTNYIYFGYNAGTIGSISQSGTTAVAYNTSSDYRLKNITGPITTSGAYIDSLNPVEGTWKADGSTFVGLIAHEVQEASRTPIATGTKDGVEMQGMDYSNSELIANLIAEVKSLRQRVAQLEAK